MKRFKPIIDSKAYVLVLKRFEKEGEDSNTGEREDYFKNLFKDFLV